MGTDTTSSWTEDDSTTFLDLADVAVIGRREQVEVLLSLIPVSGSHEFRLIDVCCGDGTISEAVLQRFGGARVLGFDGSESMRRAARKRLAPYGDRAEIEAFNLHEMRWLDRIGKPRCVVSSLALHHLDGVGKRRIFEELAVRIEPGGALLIADVVAPASDAALTSHRASWHRAAKEQSIAIAGSTKLYDRAVAESWAYYDDIDTDPDEQPSILFDQLKWLEEAGFSTVDCFWLRSGFAIYGGYV